jgi:uncharacterized protein (TIGR03435 family)
MRSLLIALLSLPALAQTPASEVAGFEVAVVKSSMPIREALPLIQAGKLKVGINIGKARVDISFVTLEDLIVAAYKVKPYQVSGPDWIKLDRYDIQAKLPDAATPEQVPQMLQKLLAERFQLGIHREQRELPVYELTVGKKGPRLQPSVEPEVDTSNVMSSINPTSKGSIITGGPMGTTRMINGPNGMRLELLRGNMAGFGELLTKLLGRPVLDRTGLKGLYQIGFDIPAEDVQNLARAIGAGPMTAPPPGTDPGGSTMFQAVEDMGLKLVSAKDPVDLIIIDHAERKPTEN